MGKKIDLRGQPFGKLTVIEEAGRTKSGRVLWRCRCECGNEVVVRADDLRREHTRSCGCYMRELTVERSTTHGARKTRLYNIWWGIMRRVGRRIGASDQHRRDYIARGIDICEEWAVFKNFYQWAMANGYRDGLEIDRIDNEKGYFPANCHWVARKQNVNNRRNTLRLPDGQSLALFCAGIGIETCVGRNVTNQYSRISYAYRNHKTIPPDLLDALKADTRRQCRLLYQASMVRQEFEDRLKILKQKVDSLNSSISNPIKGRGLHDHSISGVMYE